MLGLAKRIRRGGEQEGQGHTEPRPGDSRPSTVAGPGRAIRVHKARTCLYTLKSTGGQPYALLSRTSRCMCGLCPLPACGRARGHEACSCTRRASSAWSRHTCTAAATRRRPALSGAAARSAIRRSRVCPARASTTSWGPRPKAGHRSLAPSPQYTIRRYGVAPRSAASSRPCSGDEGGPAGSRQGGGESAEAERMRRSGQERSRLEAATQEAADGHMMSTRWLAGWLALGAGQIAAVGQAPGPPCRGWMGIAGSRGCRRWPHRGTAPPQGGTIPPAGACRRRCRWQAGPSRGRSRPTRQSCRQRQRRGPAAPPYVPRRGPAPAGRWPGW